MEEKINKRFVVLKILLAILPALVFTQNYGWMTLNSKLGLGFLVIWAVMVWSVWQLNEKNHVLERLFKLTEIAFFLLPLSAIIFTFVLGSKAVSSTASDAGQAGAAIGVAIGGTFVIILAFIIGLAGGIIMHLITGKYEKRSEASGIKQAETLANKHGVILALVGVILLTIIIGTTTKSATSSSNDSISVKSSNTPSAQQAKAVESYTDADLAQAVQFAKDNKFAMTDFTKKYYVGNLSSDVASNKDGITIVTPYSVVVSNLADKAKNYEDISVKDIADLKTQNNLIILASVYGDSFNFADNYTAVIKVEGQVIHPDKTKADFATTSSNWPNSPKYTTSATFTFNRLTDVKDKKIQFVLIKDSGEETFEVDMSQYK